MRSAILGLSALVLAAVEQSGSPPTIHLSAFCTDPTSTDHTACIQNWILAGSQHPDTKLYAAAGVYYYNSAATIYSGMNVECDQNRVTFKNIGGIGTLFEAEAPVSNVRFTNCGFDVNGNPTEYLAVISINHPGATQSKNVRLSGLRVYDSTIPGQFSTKQRYYLLVTDCFNCTAEGNYLSEGGRIKLGRPGSKLVIRNNVIDHANDNAITVVDRGFGTSEDILIEGNRVTNPKVTGIFFGGDGQAATGGSVTRSVRIHNNDIAGDWLLACIQGTLPTVANNIHIDGNTCRKTGTAGSFQAGISINRTDGAAQRVVNVKIDGNHVLASGCVTPGATAPLDYGGIFIAGNYDKLEIFHNEIENVGPRALYLHSVDILHGRITHNTIVGGNLIVQGTVAAPTSPNTIIAGCG